jgi:two-component system response regulator YesN
VVFCLFGVAHGDGKGGGSKQGSVDSQTVKSPDYPLAKERTLLSLIAQGDYANANQLLNELLGFVLFSSGRDMGLSKARILELVVLMSRAALEGGASVEAILRLNNSFLAQVQKIATIEDLSVSLAAMLKRFADCVSTQKSTRHADLIQKAVRFLNAHYAQRIDLHTVSLHLHMSAAHFSKVFKEETGQGFVH